MPGVRGLLAPLFVGTLVAVVAESLQPWQRVALGTVAALALWIEMRWEAARPRNREIAESAVIGIQRVILVIVGIAVVAGSISIMAERPATAIVVLVLGLGLVLGLLWLQW
jgi:hypothetical protein